jgi:hypothetical protein
MAGMGRLNSVYQIAVYVGWALGNTTASLWQLEINNHGHYLATRAKYYTHKYNRAQATHPIIQALHLERLAWYTIGYER